MQVVAHERFAWAQSDPDMQADHVPECLSRPADPWEMVMLEGFQSGSAWIINLSNREVLRRSLVRAESRNFRRGRCVTGYGNPGYLAFELGERQTGCWEPKRGRLTATYLLGETTDATWRRNLSRRRRLFDQLGDGVRV